ncbi:MAG TPA: diguanylate cyclase [Nitrospirota bacterium]
MVTESTGGCLAELFRSEKWRDHFTTLSDTLGFSLSIYSQTGEPIFVSQEPFPLCRGIRSSSDAFSARCASYCHRSMMETLSTGKRAIFKCYAKIMSFAFPIEYLGDKAVILGQGSFSSYEDFREFMNLINTDGLEMPTIPTPLVFTSSEQAAKICDFVSDSVTRLLENSQETIALRKKFEHLKTIIGMWGIAAEERPDALYKEMIGRLSSLLDIECIAILVFDNRRSRYSNLYSFSRSGRPLEVISLSEHNVIVKELLAGKPFVLSAEPVRDSRADFLNGLGAMYFFPIMVHKKLEGILRIEDRVLREGDKQIIAAFCQQASLSLENHHMRQDLNKKLDRFAAVSELTKAITPIQNFQTLIRTILDKSADLLKAEQGSLMLLDQNTDDLLLEVKKGVVEGVSERLRISRGEGIAGKVAELGEPILVENVENDPRTRQKNRQHYKTRSFVSVPLKINERTIGVLNLADKASGEVFTDEDLHLIQSFATHAAVVMERNVYYHRNEELKKLTITDPLTGLLNRRYLSERLKDELARSERHGHSLSLLMLDLDGFKFCNDEYGHAFGDEILKSVADIFLNTVRSMDVVSRFGGDEFMVILPETGETLAIDIAERIRNAVAKRSMATRMKSDSAAPQCALTASIGIVCFPEHGDTVEFLLENVDKALYRAKSMGKNRIEVFS